MTILLDKVASKLDEQERSLLWLLKGGELMRKNVYENTYDWEKKILEKVIKVMSKRLSKRPMDETNGRYLALFGPCSKRNRYSSVPECWVRWKSSVTND